MGSMFDDNPNLIQDPPPPSDDGSPWVQHHTPTPLVLIHDGGGTIFSYYCLDNLDRAVYGISNPRYPTGEAWPGGIPEMARHYLGFIKRAVPQGGDLIIGGWSLGGLISLEVARQLAEENVQSRNISSTKINLIGIVMVDSVCPLILKTPMLPVVQHAVQWGEHTRQETRDRVMHCFSEATRMVREWKLPVWDDYNGNKTKSQQQNGLNGNVYTNGQIHRNISMTSTSSTRPPPVILLRAMEPVPVPEDGVSRVDIHRNDRLLGWGSYRADLITKVIDIPGHHFNIFHTEETCEATTEGIKRACLDLEAMKGRV